MSEYDLHSNIDDRVALNLQDITTGTVAGVIIDTSSFESIEFIIQAGSINDGTYTLLLEEANDAGMSGATAVSADETLGALTGFISTDDNTTIRVGSIGKKRYQRLSIVAASSTGTNEFSAVAVLGNPHTSPVAQ